MRTTPAKEQTETHARHATQEDNEISPRDNAFETHFNKGISRSGEATQNKRPVPTRHASNRQFAVDAKKTLKRPSVTNPCSKNAFLHQGDPKGSVVKGSGEEAFCLVKKPRLETSTNSVDGIVPLLERSNRKRVMEEEIVANGRGEPIDGGIDGSGEERLRDVKKRRLESTVYRVDRNVPFSEGHIHSSREAMGGMEAKNGLFHKDGLVDNGMNGVGEDFLGDVTKSRLDTSMYRIDASVPFSGNHIHTSREATRGMVTENGASSSGYGRHQQQYDLRIPTGTNLTTPVNGVGVQDRFPEENCTSSCSSSVDRLPREGRFAFLRRTRSDRRARAKLRVERLKRALEDAQMRQLEGLEQGERRRIIERIEDERMEREKARRREVRRVRNRESVERSRVRERGFEKEVGDEGDVLRWENGMKAVLEFCRGTAEVVREEVARVLGKKHR